MTTHPYKGRSIEVTRSDSLGAWSYCCTAGNGWGLAGIQPTQEAAIAAAKEAIDRFDREEQRSHYA